MFSDWHSFSFKNASGAHASADAHGDDTESLLGALKFGHEGADHAAASVTEGVAKGDSASLRVQLLARNAQFVHSVCGLRSKGLIDLENIDVIDSETTLLQSDGD